MLRKDCFQGEMNVTGKASWYHTQGETRISFSDVNPIDNLHL